MRLFKLKEIQLIKAVNDSELVQVLLLVLLVARATNDEHRQTGLARLETLLRTVSEVEEVLWIALRQARHYLAKAATVVLEGVVSVEEVGDALADVALGAGAQKELLHVWWARGEGVHFDVQRLGGPLLQIGKHVGESEWTQRF